MSKSSAQICVILAGGLGTRLRSVVSDLPKCLAPVNGTPFLEIQIEQLIRIGVEEVVLSLGFLSEKVIEYLHRKEFPLKVNYVVEQTPLGTGGAIANILDELHLDEILVANGDTYLDGNMQSMLNPLAQTQGELLRMATVEVPDRARYGGIVVDDAGKVLRFLEKGKAGPGPINAGLYRLCRRTFSLHGRGKLSIETDVLPGLAKNSNVTSCSVIGEFIDIGNPDDYQRFILQHAKRQTRNQVVTP